jgi:hypothetical protein
MDPECIHLRQLAREHNEQDGEHQRGIRAENRDEEQREQDIKKQDAQKSAQVDILEKKARVRNNSRGYF